jgi:AcrR family transcriptional regulator
MIADKADRLLAATVACLATQGFTVSSATLAAQAGVGEGTLFRTFPSRAALLAATYPYVLTRLTPSLPSPQPGARLQAVLAAWWLAAAEEALAQPAVFACWRLWRGSASADPGLVYGPFATVRVLLHQALGQLPQLPVGLLPPRAVVPLFTAQWAAAVELAQAGPSAEARPLLQTLFTSWWASTGWSDKLAAVPDLSALTGIAQLVYQHE